MRGIVRPLDPSDPRSHKHPSHKETWIRIAEALGAAMADREWNRLHGVAITGVDTVRQIGVYTGGCIANEEPDEDRRRLRPLLKQAPPEG